MNVLLVFTVISMCSACQSNVKPDITTSSTTSTETVPIHPPDLLPVPDPNNLVIQEGDKVDISWDPVQGSDDNPILGIKVKLWAQERQKVYKSNGTQFIFEWEPVVKPILELPHHAPESVKVLPPNATKTSFENLKRGEEYEIRAQTFNNNGDGPLSSAFGFKLH